MRVVHTNVLMLIKRGGVEKYIFHYEDAERQKMLDLLDDFVARAELSFSQKDANAVSERINEQKKVRHDVRRF